LKRFKEKHGNYDVSQSSKEYKPLGKWSSYIRSAYKGTGAMKLSEDRICRLEAIGFKWTVSPRILFDKRVEELKRFKEKYGHCDVSESSKEYKSFAKWSYQMRRTYKGRGTMKLSEDRICRLEAIGFKWTTTMTKSFQKESECDPAGGTVNKEDAEYLPCGDQTSATQYQNDEGL